MTSFISFILTILILPTTVGDQIADASAGAGCGRERVVDTDGAGNTANTANVQDATLSSPLMLRCKLVACTSEVR